MSRAIKRILDFTVALGMLLVLSPVIAAAYVVILIRLGRPVVFRQERPGYKGRPFHVYKFRTMMRSTHRNGRPLRDDERIGRLGKLIRKLSLDELPQLVNVLRGEMSLIGPRPLLMEYLDRYTSEQMRRHDMKPGITGLAQVSGRNTVDWDRKFDLDVWYVDHWSLWLDLRIVVRTILKVLKAEGVSAQGLVSVEKFTGTRGDKA